MTTIVVKKIEVQDILGIGDRLNTKKKIRLSKPIILAEFIKIKKYE